MCVSVPKGNGSPCRLEHLLVSKQYQVTETQEALPGNLPV